MVSQFIRAGLAVAALGISAARAELTWLTDYDAAVKQARDEGKVVLINFTGSDWCGWCIKLKGEVFDTADFASFASANLVLLEVDFPRRKPQSAAQRKANEALQEKFRVQGYPTLAVVNSGGRQLAELGYVEGGPAAFIGELKKTRGVSWKNAGNAPSSAGNKPAAGEAPLFGGQTFPAKRYDELKLTGLSGTATRRFAIVNNQTFAPGESARVRLKDGEVKLLCKEIRARSAIVLIEGTTEPKELFLDGN